MLISANYKNAYAALNQYASRVSGPELSFEVHFWGANPAHILNSIYKHSSFWIGYVLAGHGSYVEENMTSPLSAGTFFCSRPHVWRLFQSDRGLSILWVSFRVIEADSASESLIREFRRLGESPDCIRHNAGHTPTSKIWEALWAQAEQFQLSYASILSGTAYSLLVSFLQLFGETRSADAENGRLRPRMSSVLLRQAKWFIADNYSFPLKLDEVARHLHISGRHLSRLFFEEDGLSFSAYMKRFRMDKAIHDLVETDKPLEQIAQECGFGSIYYFTRVCAAETGLPPGQYRKKNAHV